LQSIQVDNEVTLRPFDVRDAAAFFEVIDANRDYLCRWIPALEGIHSVQDEREALERLAARQREGDILGGSVEYLGRLVGSASISGLGSRDSIGGLGYWLVENAQRRGIVTRACRALVDRAFNEEAVKRVDIMAAAQNRSSRAVADRLGFTLQRILRRRLLCGGRLHDVAVYSLLASEWAQPAG